MMLSRMMMTGVMKSPMPVKTSPMMLRMQETALQRMPRSHLRELVRLSKMLAQSSETPSKRPSHSSPMPP